jgi:membrane protein implicated in regulation of membrane protease activity
MTSFYLVCFLVGVALSVLSVFGGSARLHLPHVHIHFAPHAHLPVGGAQVRGLGPINFGTVAAFLAWFGGTGYLLAHYYSAWLLVGLILAGLSGLAAAAVVFFFVAKVLIRADEVLDPADYEMVGVLGKVNSAIRPSGTGEIIFSQAGARRAAPARSEDELVIPKGAEVVVTRYERGIAYVRPWEELTKSAAQAKEGL